MLSKELGWTVLHFIGLEQAASSAELNTRFLNLRSVPQYRHVVDNILITPFDFSNHITHMDALSKSFLYKHASDAWNIALPESFRVNVSER